MSSVLDPVRMQAEGAVVSVLSSPSQSTPDVAARGDDTHTVRVVEMREEALSVLSVALRPVDEPVRPFDAGAHVALELPGGLQRSYSLVNAPHARDCYRIGVALGERSRGGARYIHQQLRVGQTLRIGAPRNLFALHEGVEPSVLIAGGIGITPIYAMAQALDAAGRDWTLHYACKSAAHAAFLAPLRALGGSRVHVYFNQDAGRPPVSIADVVQRAAPETHLYCCGPAGMLDAFVAATRPRDPSRVHLERFATDGAALPSGAGSAFDVVLARSGGRRIRVEADQSILDAVLAAGVDAPWSCREGVCGTCETAVLAGTPAHADSVLSAAEQAAGRSMMICCSRARGDLTLDL